MVYLSDEIKMTLIQAPIAADQSDNDSSSVDMQGFDGVLFIGVAGTISGSGTATLTVEQSADDSTFNVLTGPEAVATAAAHSDKALMIDVKKPTDRYLRTNMTSAVGNVEYGGTIALQYTARSKPTTQDATSLAVALVQVVTPVET